MTSPPERLARFSPAVRITHWLNAIGFAILTFTGAVLYFPKGSEWIGHREVVRNTHVWTGLLLLLPLLYAYVWSSSLRDDVRRLARWTRDDQRWWFPSQRDRVRLGKFNPGQKVNASFTFAALVTLLGTGSIMKWNRPFSDDVRTGATFVHDWTALVIGIVVVGHIVMAFRDFESLRGMARGRVRAEWAARERPRWHAEMTAGTDLAPVTDAAQNDPEPVGEPR
jgi:formate dehydrogenase subunit gamma